LALIIGGSHPASFYNLNILQEITPENQASSSRASKTVEWSNIELLKEILRPEQYHFFTMAEPAVK
jgi:hypothetical protein